MGQELQSEAASLQSGATITAKQGSFGLLLSEARDISKRAGNLLQSGTIAFANWGTGVDIA